MRCIHCGERIFLAFEFTTMTPEGDIVHNFKIRGGRLECAPFVPPEKEREILALLATEEVVLA